MTKDGIASLFLVVGFIAELITGFGNNTIHFWFGMAVITALTMGE